MSFKKLKNNNNILGHKKIFMQWNLDSPMWSVIWQKDIRNIFNARYRKYFFRKVGGRIDSWMLFLLELRNCCIKQAYILWANLLPVSDRNLCDLSTVTNLPIFWKDLYLNLVALLAYQRKRFRFAFDIFILFMMTSLYSIGYIRKDKENYQWVEERDNFLYTPVR